MSAGHRLGLLALLSLLSSCEGCVKRDLDEVCNAAKEAAEDEDIHRQRTRWGMKVADRVTKAGAVRKALRDLDELPAVKRYGALRAAAKKLGHPGWQCPELEAILDSSADEAVEEDEAPAPAPAKPAPPAAPDKRN